MPNADTWLARWRERAGYEREALFGPPYADLDHNGCDQRNDVLRRDLDAVSFRPGRYVPFFELAGPGPAEAAPERRRVTDRLNPRTVAVLPFVNLSPDTDHDYFCDGITPICCKRLIISFSAHFSTNLPSAIR